MSNLNDRLRRYSKKCLAEKLDEDFAEAVYYVANIVTCADCEHVIEFGSVGLGCYLHYMPTQPDFFCADGVVKNG